MAEHRKSPRTSRPMGAVLGCALVIAAAGCTSATAPGPGPVSGTLTTAAPDSRTGQAGTGLIPPDTATGSIVPSATNTGSAGPPAPPEAATLAWLSGVPASDGILLTEDGVKRWQGPTPGDYARIGDAGYQWFGADGSMVGCTTSGACIGVDDDGLVATTTGTASPRLVYDASGAFVGQFSARGERLPAPTSPPTLDRSVADTGVDLSALVNTATLGAPFAGGVTGDPHLITAGGVRLTTQRVGQFVARGGDPAHAIQVQFAPMPHRQDVSVVSEAAVGSGRDTVTVDMAGTLTVNGVSRPPQPGFEQLGLTSGAAVGRWPANPQRVVTVAVVWPDGGSVVIAANPALGLTVVAHLPPVPDAAGLFGTAGQGTGADLLTRSGKPDGVDKVVSSWTVAPGETLFASPPDTAPDFPTQSVTLDTAAQQVARRACDGQGLQRAEDLAACTFDVALTGDSGFVAGHLQMALPAERGPVAAAFASRWPALLAGSGVDASDLPAGGRLDLTLGPARYQAFRVRLDRDGVVELVNRSGCATGQNPPGMDQPAARLFDVTGHPVSDRFPLCGHQQTGPLPPGGYRLVIANGPSNDDLPVRLDVTLP